MTDIFLAVDVGATKTALALYSSERGPRQSLANATLPTQKYHTFEALVGTFLAETDYTPDCAIFAVAGPVINGRVSASGCYLPWDLDQEVLQANFKLQSLDLLNDLEAVAEALPHLAGDDLYTLQAGHPERHGTLAVIAPGTGLGEAFSLWTGERYHACASEGGNTTFAAQTPLEVDLARYLQDKFGSATHEMVCSGMGIPNIYACLKERGYAPEPDWLAGQLSAANDPTPIIVNAALQSNPPEICVATLKTFVSVLGSEAGNLALTVKATGGVYLAGGIPPRILPFLEQEKERFLSAFNNKSILIEMLVDVPVQVITHKHVALLGAACRMLAA